jgi:hypothetical protein
MGAPPTPPLLNVYLHDEFAPRCRLRVSLPLVLFVSLVVLLVVLIIWSLREP